MINTKTKTPITAEWLESVGLWAASSFRKKYVKVSAEGNGIAVVSRLKRYSVYTFDDDGDHWVGDNLTQERLSALWFALTEEELK